MRSLLLAIAVVAAPPIVAQSSSRPVRGGVTVGVVGPTRVLQVGSGVLVRTTTGPFVGAELLRDFGSGRALGLFARVSAAPVKVRVSGATYGAQTSVQTVLGVRGSQRVARRFSVRGSVGATYVGGPSDVRPYSSGTPLHPSADLALSADFGARARWSIDVGGAGYYVGTSDRVQRAGTVAGVLLGIRRAL
jgi:hypothetical protein